jgi:branched-chain amino acid transport system permease protein
LALALAALLPLTKNPVLLSSAIAIGIYVLLALGLNIVVGYAGLLDLGYVAFFAIGSYTVAALTGGILQASDRITVVHIPQVSFWVLLPLAALLAGLFGVLLGAPTLRLRGDYLAIVTLGFGEIIRVVLQNIDAVGGPRGMIGIPAYTNLFWTYGLAAVAVYVVWTMVNSTYGRGFIAVADDEIAAEAMGINTTRYKITAFLVGAIFAGLAGGVYAHFKQYIAPQGFGFDRSIEIVVMVILGGMGNTAGVIIAAILLTVLGEWLRQFGDLRMILYSLLIIVLMISRPQGLFTWSLSRSKA